jgi:aspartate aminotransferase-like enzyme
MEKGYKDIVNELLKEGFQRVERDDRLHDVFPRQTREKGIELWEKVGKTTVTIVRLREASASQKIQRFVILRPKLVSLLTQYRQCSLEKYTI